MTNAIYEYNASFLCFSSMQSDSLFLRLVWQGSRKSILAENVILRWLPRPRITCLKKKSFDSRYVRTNQLEKKIRVPDFGSKSKEIMGSQVRYYIPDDCIPHRFWRWVGVGKLHPSAYVYEIWTKSRKKAKKRDFFQVLGHIS